MSRQSKAKRDARRKRSPVVTASRPRPVLQPHAELTVDRTAVAIVARHAEEWVVFLDGKPVASTESAAMTMAVLRRIARVREGDGIDVRLAYSTELRAAAAAEAGANGQTLQAHLDQLEAEREARGATDATLDAAANQPADDIDIDPTEPATAMDHLKKPPPAR